MLIDEVRRAGGGAHNRKPTSSQGANMKFRPLHDRVLVRRLTAEEKTAGGIIIPDTAKENRWRARSGGTLAAAVTQ
jgi:hypothetical protein